ncbi:DNA alkylation response protein [Mycobacteriaceae bacterium 1482268.1]|nr:DNA alkylation response protein [Mycobacteriaceae bacterium 1482268.1]
MTGTHEVFNQAPPRVGINEFDSNAALTEGVARFGAGWATDHLSDVGKLVGRADFQRDADLANLCPPVFTSHDRWGNRVDAVEFHPSYHRVMAEAIRYGAHTSCWADPRPGAHVVRAATYMLFAQVEPGQACPVGMTHAVVPSLRLAPDLAEAWLPRVYSRVYDPELRAPDTKGSAIFGMAMTEKQGGSDVRANTTRATDSHDGTWWLTGHKWFCSAPQSDAFLILAQTTGGLSCFLVPRILPDGTRNEFRIQRLKDKLGNKSNASSEIELEDTAGWLVGEEGRGVRTIIEMVSQSRLDCVLMSAAGMRQAVAEAAWHSRHRRAFGELLIDQPAMSNVIADLQVEAEAAVWTALRLAAANDSDDDESVAFRRLATPVAKYWVCKRGPHHAYEALECLGGNGYTEQFPLARRYREQPLMAIWEGSGNVIALDVLRALTREPQSFEAFDRVVSSALGQYQQFDTHVAYLRKSVRETSTDAGAAQGSARRIVESLALALQASIVIREAPSAVADAYVAARISPARHLEYGGLSTGLDLKAIVARA